MIKKRNYIVDSVRKRLIQEENLINLKKNLKMTKMTEVICYNGIKEIKAE